MIEPEIAFADLSSDMEAAEDFLRYVVRAAITQCEPELRFFELGFEQASNRLTCGKPFQWLCRCFKYFRTQRKVPRIPRRVGNGLANRARAIPRRNGLRTL